MLPSNFLNNFSQHETFHRKKQPRRSFFFLSLLWLSITKTLPHITWPSLKIFSPEAFLFRNEKKKIRWLAQLEAKIVKLAIVRWLTTFFVWSEKKLATSYIKSGCRENRVCILCWRKWKSWWRWWVRWREDGITGERICLLFGSWSPSPGSPAGSSALKRDQKKNDNVSHCSSAAYRTSNCIFPFSFE